MQVYELKVPERIRPMVEVLLVIDLPCEPEVVLDLMLAACPDADDDDVILASKVGWDLRRALSARRRGRIH